MPLTTHAFECTVTVRKRVVAQSDQDRETVRGILTDVLNNGLGFANFQARDTAGNPVEVVLTETITVDDPA